ncbi:MAG TPA: GNAT family N-acetyltransferase [Vicinamibacterales bacterium]|jgi:predicted N-acetyltransferase YhbS
MAILVPATGDLLAQILDATFHKWNDGLSRTAYGRWFSAQLQTPWGRSHLTRWALVEGSQVLASAKLYELDAVADGRPVRIAGIGAVFTMPEHRRRGAASELVERVIEHAAAGGADLAMLFSEIDPAYYARLGFDVVPMHELSLRVTEDARRGAPATMVRAGDDRDLGEVVAMDAARAEPFRFRLRRDRSFVHYGIAKQRMLAGLAPAGARALQFFVAEEGASAVAYVVISVNGGRWTINSCGDRDPAGARLGAILQVLIAREPGEARPEIRAWLPATLRPPQIEIVGSAPSSDVMMMRALTDAGRVSPPLTDADVCYWRGDAF